MAGRLTFSKGEVAVYVNPSSRWYGEECTVAGPLMHGPVYVRPGSFEQVGTFAYPIVAPWLPSDPRVKVWVAQPHHLRKRPPKQDWKTLCKLKEISIDAVVRV